MKKWGGGSFKYIIPSIVVLILIGAIVIGRFLPKQLLESVYSIDELKENFDNIKIGDEVNYEINGYSDWQVIGKNEFDGTIDIVSKTNTEDLTLEPNQTKEYYENKFQETANKYTDNNYVINTRTVNQDDLDYFNYDNNFWLNTIDDTNITASQSTFEINPKNYKMYVIPYIARHFEDISNYNIGDTIEYSNNGVDRWVVAEVREYNSTLLLIPETPIELVIESVDDDLDAKREQIIESFSNDVNYYGNYVSTFGINNLPNLIPNFLNQQTERIYIFNYGCYNKNNNFLRYGCGDLPYYENGKFGIQSGTIYTELGPKTLGYRPVVTLKVKEEIQDKDKQEISNKLQIGDNVKYEAKGYKNWKVLSVDNDLGTVDIISGGIVKNITLSGKEDWDNYEDIIQREVDQYKNGEKAKKATTVTSKDLKILKEIDRSTLSRYCLLNKNTNNTQKMSLNGKYADIVKYNIEIINLYRYDNFEKYIENIAIYAELKGNEEILEHYKDNNMYTNNINNSSYTVGLRPVITLKLDSVEKLSDKETKEVNKTTEKQEKIYLKEQENKNKNYKGPKTVDDTSSKGTKKDEKDNNTNIIDNNNETKVVEKIVYKDNKKTRYLLISSIVLNNIELGGLIYFVLKQKNIIK